VRASFADGDRDPPTGVIGTRGASRARLLATTTKRRRAIGSTLLLHLRKAAVAPPLSPSMQRDSGGSWDVAKDA